MPSRLRDTLIALAGAAAAASAFYAATPTAGQVSAPRIPRTAAGKPDLNGIWQALNTANYDLEAHVARPALAMRPGPVIPVPAKEVIALGAVGSVPGGPGVVVGGTIPYTPDGLATDIRPLARVEYERLAVERLRRSGVIRVRRHDGAFVASD